MTRSLADTQDQARADADAEKQRRAAEFYDAVGRAVVLWSEVEAQLFALLKALTGLDEKIVAVLYERAGTIYSRIELLEEIIACRSPSRPSPMGDASDAIAELKKVIFVRNLIVHHPARWAGGRVQFGLTEDESSLIFVSEDPGHLGTVRSAMSELRGKTSGAVKRLDAASIREHRAHVHKIGGRLAFAVQEMRPRP